MYQKQILFILLGTLALSGCMKREYSVVLDPEKSKEEALQLEAKTHLTADMSPFHRALIPIKGHNTLRIVRTQAADTEAANESASSVILDAKTLDKKDITLINNEFSVSQRHPYIYVWLKKSDTPVGAYEIQTDKMRFPFPLTEELFKKHYPKATFTDLTPPNSSYDNQRAIDRMNHQRMQKFIQKGRALRY